MTMADQFDNILINDKLDIAKKDIFNLVTDFLEKKMTNLYNSIHMAKIGLFLVHSIPFILVIWLLPAI